MRRWLPHNGKGLAWVYTDGPDNRMNFGTPAVWTAVIDNTRMWFARDLDLVVTPPWIHQRSGRMAGGPM